LSKVWKESQTRKIKESGFTPVRGEMFMGTRRHLPLRIRSKEWSDNRVVKSLVVSRSFERSQYEVVLDSINLSLLTE